ncbi:MAG: hypothetical protein A3H35_17575 [Betaproteobacteria bacterium RIFCSPLOWO2_02_FULL_62_17]|nr:MAG: hypothetical protein A3H35_17575 [Betaproteobacteria bacterium RIFCSPLOWO2_02_FULL_62_17]
MKNLNNRLADLRANPDWAKLPLFDRKGCKRLPFGAFAESVNERVEPSDAADEIYVGLNDLDPQNLHICRWGKGSDVIGTKLRFRKGDIIFGRRRAYQRKLAVAEFDGIVADINDIVKKVRFPDWQHTTQGERLVQRELRKTLLKYKLHTDQDLFDRAYGYIKQYY